MIRADIRPHAASGNDDAGRYKNVIYRQPVEWKVAAPRRRPRRAARRAPELTARINHDGRPGRRVEIARQHVEAGLLPRDAPEQRAQFEDAPPLELLVGFMGHGRQARRLRSIHAVFSWSCMRWVRRSQVG